MNRILGIDYGDSRVGLAITDLLGITVQGLETVHINGNDKVFLKRLDEILAQYPEIDTFVVGLPLNMNGTMTDRVEVTQNFIHKLKCKYNKIKIETMDERLTTVEAHKTMNMLNVDNRKKRGMVDTISAVFILEDYMKMMKNKKENNE
jgi:putative Holliday junction resolvase